MSMLRRIPGLVPTIARSTAVQGGGSLFPCASRIQGIVSRSMTSGPGLDITGIYPPIATPFDEQENINYEKLEFNINKWNKIDFRGYVVQGSNGEYAYLTPEERVEMVAKVRALVPKEKLILAGSGCESTRDTVAMTEKMAAAGADAVLVVTPCYYKSGMTNTAMVKHFTRVADESPVPVILHWRTKQIQVADESPVPVILYSVPPNTTIDLAPEVVIQLAPHPNIIGLKDSGGDISKIGSMLYGTRNEEFKILAGSASFLYPALSLGCVGGVCALANILGEACLELQTLSMAGRHEEARQLQLRLIAPNTGVTRRFGVPGLKQAMSWFGYHGGPTRSPLQPLSTQETEALRRMFNDSGFTVHENRLI